MTLLFTFSAFSAQAQQRAAPVEELREVEGERARVEFLLRQLDNQEVEVLEVLEEAQREAQQASAEAKQARESKRHAQERLKVALLREEELVAQRKSQQKSMEPRLLLRYRLDKISPLQLLLSAPRLGDWLWQQRMLSKLVEGDLAQALELSTLETQVRSARLEVERERTFLAEAEEDARRRARKALLQEQSQQALLTAARSERKIHERRVAELETARQRLLVAIAAMPAPPPGLGGFAGKRGRLPHPVKGVVEVKFGPRSDPQFGTVTHHKGIDIRAPQGESVRCPHPAQVGFAGPFRGYGNLVVLDHGEAYYTLYAHLDQVRVKAGDRLEEGEILGSVGTSGSLKGPYLYFEIRSGARALNPAEWLSTKP